MQCSLVQPLNSFVFCELLLSLFFVRVARVRVVGDLWALVAYYTSCV